MAEQREGSARLLDAAKPVFEEANRAWNEGDFQRAYAALPEDFIYNLAVTWPNARPLHGPDEIVAFFEDFRETFPDARAGPLQYEGVDEQRMIVGFPVRGSGRSSGATTTMEIWQLWEIGDELRPRRVREFPDRRSALEAAGAEAPTRGETA